MHVVDVQCPKPVHLDVTREHRQFVDLGLGLPPVKPILPMGS